MITAIVWVAAMVAVVGVLMVVAHRTAAYLRVLATQGQCQHLHAEPFDTLDLARAADFYAARCLSCRVWLVSYPYTTATDRPDRRLALPVAPRVY